MRQTCNTLVLLTQILFLPVLCAQTGETSVDEKNDVRELVVATRNVPPFSIKDGDQWRGISVDLLNEVVKQWNEDADQPTRLVFRETSLQEMLDLTAEGKVDLASGALTLNFDREERMDFSHPYHSSGLGIAVAPDRKSGWMAVLSRIFSSTFLQLIGGLFVLFVASGVLMYVVERRANREQFGRGFWRGAGSGVWWSIVTLTTVGYGDKAPKTLVGRGIAVFWMLSGLLIISSFTAAVTSTLTIGQLQSRVNGMADLPRVRVGTVGDTTSQDFLKRRLIRHRVFGDLTLALSELESGKLDAVVYDAPMLRFHVAREYPGLHVLPGVFERQNYAFAMPSDSELREPLNQSILRALNKASWQETLDQYLNTQSLN